MSKPKLFDEDTSLFSVIKNIDASGITLKTNLKWMDIPMENKLQFCYCKKSTVINLFSQNANDYTPSLYCFNSNTVVQTFLQKYLSTFLDSKLNFSAHLNLFSRELIKP